MVLKTKYMKYIQMKIVLMNVLTDWNERERLLIRENETGQE